MTDPSKKFSQTRLSSYFTGCSRTPDYFDEKPLNRKRRIRRTWKKLSFSATSRSDMADDDSLSMDSLLASIPKRKLPAPIFSDDEEEENDHPEPSKRGDVSPIKRAKVLISLNRPGPISPQKLPLSPTSSMASNSSMSSLNKTLSNERLTIAGLSSSNVTPSKSNIKTKNPPEKNVESVTVLQNVVVTPKKSPQKETPKKSPQQETPKDETKKVNFEQLRVIREFFTNIIKNNHLIKLFSPTDKDLLYKFFNMEKNYQFVCIKLFLWQPIWYNIFKFVEKIGLSMDDSEINDMYNHLKENAFVETDYMFENTFTLLDLLNLKDVRDIGRSFRLDMTGKKDIVIGKLLKNCKTQITLTTNMNSEEVLRERIKEKMGFCVKLSTRLSKCLYSVYLLNTFANVTLTEPQDYFKNVTYFNTVFPTYNVDNFHIFYTPLELSRFADAVKLRSGLDKAVEKRNTGEIFEICKCAYDRLKNSNEEFGDSFDDSREPHLERFTPNAQYAQILTSGSPHITTRYFDEVKIWFEYLLSQGYCKHQRGVWYTHLSLIYTLYTKDYEAAAKLIIKALKEEKDNFSDIQLQDLTHRGKMLNKKTYNLGQLFHDEVTALSEPSCDRDWPRDIIECKSITSDEAGRRRTYVFHGEDGDVNYLTVEQLALQHYRTIGFPKGEHCEGSLTIALFCLLFWDIIYETYVKGTFVSNVQNAPLDMHTEYFYINREDKIKKRLNNIKQSWSEATLKKRLFENWQLHSHETSLCQIDSVVDSAEILYDVISCIGRPIVAKIFERLVTNFRRYHSGFPDLIVWNLEEKKAKFVEVKSENDKLSIKQKLWLNYLIDAGASVAVCHVEPKASKKKLNVKRKGSKSEK